MSDAKGSNGSPKKASPKKASPKKAAASPEKKPAAAAPAKKNFGIFDLKRKAGAEDGSNATAPADEPPAKIAKVDPAAARAAADAKAGNTFEALKAQLIDPGWRSVLEKEMSQDYFKQICKKVDETRKAGKQVFPPENQIFAAFAHTPFKGIRAVILGQDPYHDDKQAHGLCFSVNHGIAVPPSLKNMYTELAEDIPGFKVPNHGNLEGWAQQGVLLLNATLTVEAHQPNSHASFGWQKFTDSVIKMISTNLTGVVFLLWGGFAQKKAKLIDGKKHCIIQAAHPSPLSVTKWRGCKVFSQTNAYLQKNGKPPINWQV